MTHRVIRLGLGLALMGLGAMGCDGGGTGRDSGTPSDSGTSDSGSTTDSGAPPDVEPVGVCSSAECQMSMDLGALSPADYSCIGTGTAPDDSGATVTFNGEVTDFFTGDAVQGLTVQFFPDNVPSLDGTCTGACIEAVSGADGTVPLMDNEGSWYAYRIVAGSGMIPAGAQEYIEVVQYNELTPAMGGAETLNAVQASTRDTIVALLGVTPEAGTATLTGAVLDCAGQPVANADVRLFDSSGPIETGFRPTGPREFYFNGSSFPSAPQRLTHVDGLYGVANVPLPADDTVRVEIWGAVAAGEEPQMLGCEQVQVVEDGITIVNVGPARSDAPSGCGG